MACISGSSLLRGLLLEDFCDPVCAKETCATSPSDTATARRIRLRNISEDSDIPRCDWQRRAVLAVGRVGIGYSALLISGCLVIGFKMLSSLARLPDSRTRCGYFSPP